MENASKALLIAAAVLVVILIIAFGMQIINSADTSSQLDSTASTQDMQQFNAQVTAYIGKSRAATTIPNLLAIVNNSNTSNTQHDITIVASSEVITNAAASASAQAQVTKQYSVGAKFVSNAKYSITASYDASGYIYAITIK